MKNILLVLEAIKKHGSFNSDAQVAKALGMTPVAFYNHKKRNTIPFKALAKFCAKEKISIDALLRGEDTSEYVSIPLLGAVASAGPGRENEDDEIIDYCKFKASWIRKFGSPRNLALMTISGDSMAPTLSKGDVIMIDKSETAPRDDRIYVINSGGSTVIKRLQLRGKSVWALSDNEKTNPPYQIEKDSNIIGRIVWFGRKLI